jgi:hypothetical protein
MTQSRQPTDREQRALTRAIERRFGKSLIPYRFQYLGTSIAEGAHWRVTDLESGSYVQGVFHLGRLHVRKHHDAMLYAAVEAKSA